MAWFPGVQAHPWRARADGLDLTIAVDALIEPAASTGRAIAITAADRRFPRSLRIAAEP